MSPVEGGDRQLRLAQNLKIFLPLLPTVSGRAEAADNNVRTLRLSIWRAPTQSHSQTPGKFKCPFSNSLLIIGFYYSVMEIRISIKINFRIS